MFLSSSKSKDWLACVLLAAVLSFACSGVSQGQDKADDGRTKSAMNYSSENPAWLTFIGQRGKSSGSGWWSSWKVPGWKTTGSKKKSSGWWSGAGSSSYSKDNKTTMQKVSQTSKRWWNNTVEFLDPYAPPKERPSNGQSKPGFFDKLFGRQDSEPQFHSVPEWGKQPMPK